MESELHKQKNNFLKEFKQVNGRGQGQFFAENLFHFQYKYLKIRKQRKQDDIFVIIGENQKEIKILIQTKCTLQCHLAVK